MLARDGGRDPNPTVRVPVERIAARAGLMLRQGDLAQRSMKCGARRADHLQQPGEGLAAKLTRQRQLKMMPGPQLCAARRNSRSRHSTSAASASRRALREIVFAAFFCRCWEFRVLRCAPCLFCAQRRQRVHLRGAARRDVAGEDGDDQQCERHRHERGRIARLDAVELRLDLRPEQQRRRRRRGRCRRRSVAASGRPRGRGPSPDARRARCAGRSRASVGSRGRPGRRRRRSRRAAAPGSRRDPRATPSRAAARRRSSISVFMVRTLKVASCGSAPPTTLRRTAATGMSASVRTTTVIVGHRNCVVERYIVGRGSTA